MNKREKRKEQEKRKIYLLCRHHFGQLVVYGIFTSKHLLVAYYYKVLKEDPLLEEHPNRIAIYEFKENALAGEFLEFYDDATKTFYEGYERIDIKELETDN